MRLSVKKHRRQTCPVASYLHRKTVPGWWRPDNRRLISQRDPLPRSAMFKTLLFYCVSKITPVVPYQPATILTRFLMRRGETRVCADREY